VSTTFTAEEFRAIGEKATLPRLLCIPGALLAGYCLSFSVFGEDPLTIVSLILIAAYMMLCWTSCFHECAHQTLTTTRWINIWLGRLIGTVVMVPYTVYRETHIRHHAFLNKPNDWELWPYSDPECSLTFRRFFVWLDLFFGTMTSPIIYGRIYFHPKSPLSDSTVRRTIRYEYFAILLFWSSVLALVTWDHSWPNFLRNFATPWIIAGFLQTGRKLTEHLGMPSYDPLLGTRTVIGANPLTRIATYMNFDIFVHGIHHRHPRIAHHELCEKMQDYIVTNPSVSYPVYSSYWQATKSMLPFLWNPGCGANANAGAPNSSKRDDVHDFVADVSEEILSDQDVGRVGGNPGSDAFSALRKGV
jgi:fatty acid desaturase